MSRLKMIILLIIFLAVKSVFYLIGVNSVTNMSPLEAFKTKILASTFSCVGAKACINRKSHASCLCDTIGTKESARTLYNGLSAFIKKGRPFEKRFASFIAFFKKETLSAKEYELRLWQQLAYLNALDNSDWDTCYSADTRDPTFAFSLCGQAFFVIGLKPDHPRACRRFEYPVLVFNPMSQFDYLRRSNKFSKIQETVRAREKMWHGGINPNLRFETLSDALQYSGVAATEKWQCPVNFTRN